MNKENNFKYDFYDDGDRAVLLGGEPCSNDDLLNMFPGFIPAPVRESKKQFNLLDLDCPKKYQRPVEVRQAGVVMLSNDMIGVPADFESPNWDKGGKVHNWKRYADPGLREVWPSLSSTQKAAISSSLKAVAYSEEWD